MGTIVRLQVDQNNASREIQLCQIANVGHSAEALWPTFFGSSPAEYSDRHDEYDVRVCHGTLVNRVHLLHRS